jgi:hypothetical protein
VASKAAAQARRNRLFSIGSVALIVNTSVDVRSAILATKSEPDDRTKRDPEIVVLAVIEVNRVPRFEPQSDRPQTYSAPPAG